MKSFAQRLQRARSQDIPDPAILSSEELTGCIGSQEKRIAAAGLGFLVTLLGGVVMAAGEEGLQYQDQSSGIARAAAFGMLVTGVVIASTNMLNSMDAVGELSGEEQRRYGEQQGSVSQDLAVGTLSLQTSDLIAHGDN